MASQVTSTPTLSLLLPLKCNSTSFLQPSCIQARKVFGLTSLRCKATPNHSTQQGSSNGYQVKNNQNKDLPFPLTKWPNHLDDDADNLHVPSHHHLKVELSDELKENIERIRTMLRSMGDGEISVSPYDTAWVALVEDVHDTSGKPQFPTSIQWIVDNQLEDGSWGEENIFEAHDRIINTLGCVIALKSWNIYPEKCEKGMTFLKQNLKRLGDEKHEHMPIGFEIAFPSLIGIARGLGIQLSDESGVLEKIYEQRRLKLERIPMEILHNRPTTLLHTLEGITDLNWEKLIKLQNKDGSFLFSPASTAYALMQTKDLNCLKYLENAVSKFNGGVPNVYPVDLFEHIWVVDRLQRLGISRYFKEELKECVKYVHKHWTEHGICWARDSEVQDIDDTAMGFRILRLHGYNVSPDVFKYFKKDGEFFCFARQSNQAVTGIYNLYRASQVQYPGEDILEKARNFSSIFLGQKQDCNQLDDKWIIQKDLPGEVGYALDIPLCANLPRIETRFYLEQYGGENDVWIGKTLYRMPYVNNNIYLELAKEDYNTIQTMHRVEWDGIRRWFDESELKEYGLAKTKLLRLYFVAAASGFEPERSNERLAWAKTAALLEAITSYFVMRQGSETKKQRQRFAYQLLTAFDDSSNSQRKWSGLVGLAQGTLREISSAVMAAHGADVRHQLQQAWETWVVSWAEIGDRYNGEAELVARTIQACSEGYGSTALEDYKHLFHLTSSVCDRLNKNTAGEPVGAEVDANMRRLLEKVVSKDGLDGSMKQSFWEVARSYYYLAYCSPATIDSHLAKVMFESVA